MSKMFTVIKYLWAGITVTQFAWYFNTLPALDTEMNAGVMIVSLIAIPLWSLQLTIGILIVAAVAYGICVAIKEGGI